MIGDRLLAYKSAAAVYSETDLMQAFELFDLKRSGRIDAGELKEALMGTGDGMAEDDVDFLLQEALASSNHHEDTCPSIAYIDFVKTLKNVL